MKKTDLWQTTFNAITDVIMILDGNFRVKMLNQAAVGFFDLPEKEILGKTCFRLLHGTEEQPVGCPLDKMIETKAHQESEVFLENRGRWVRISVDPIVGNDGDITEIIHIMKDITDHKEKEALLRKNQAKYKSIFNDSPICLMEMDGTAIKKELIALMESGVTDLHQYFDDHPEEVLRLLSMIWFVDVNKAVLDLYGVKSKRQYFEILKRMLTDTGSDGNRVSNFTGTLSGIMPMEEVRETLITLGVGKTVYETELAYPTGVGDEKRYFDARWSVPAGAEQAYNRVLISMIEITKLKKTEAALRESEEKYRNVVEKSLVGFFIAQNNVFRYVNQRFCDIFGYSFKEAVDNLSILDLAHPENRQRVEESLNHYLTEKTGSIEAELRMIRKDGKMIIIKVLIGSMAFNGKPAVMGTVIDVTQERNLEYQLRQAHKMEAIGTLAGGIAHDFNNLLMTILGYVSLMQTDPKIDGDNRENLKIIEGQVQSGAELTKQLLGFARGGKYEVVPTNLNELLARTAEMFGRTKKEIRIINRKEKDIWTVDVDRGQIEQVFLNLLVNAWQAMPAGGDLYLRTQNVVVDEDHSSSPYLKPGRYVKTSVTDQGAGMDEKTRQRIFEPFFTTKEMGRGTGLGLASTYGIIKNHGGAINVYSEKGQGTTFNIYLPATDREVAQGKSMAREILKGSETILIVDDQEPVIKVGSAMLKNLGYTVLTAPNGTDAIALYKKKGEEIDLVILDMVMPGISGSEVFDTLKSMNPEIRVILSSGYSINGQAMRILSRGCSGFIQKPFSLIDLSRKIREVLA
ncbi:MAG: PAS domain S-box protein [Deltaproteobacteria bacterium]|nr:PAS domain S-box protein [Deltaproteobacteria bacterium]